MARHKAKCKAAIVIGLLKEDINAEQSKIKQLHEQIGDLNKTIQTIQSADHDSLISEISALTQKVEDKDEQIKTKDQQLVEKDEQIQKLQDALMQKPTYKVYKDCNVLQVINPFGCESLDHITEQDKIRALRDVTTAIPSIVEQIHFGDERKNRNVKLPNKRGREVLVYKEMNNGDIKQVHEDINEVVESMIANGKFVLDPVAEKINHTKYQKFRKDLSESERLNGKLYNEQKSAVKRKLMDNTND